MKAGGTPNVVDYFPRAQVRLGHRKTASQTVSFHDLISRLLDTTLARRRGVPVARVRRV